MKEVYPQAACFSDYTASACIHTHTLSSNLHICTHSCTRNKCIHCSSQPYHMSAAALNAFHSLLLKQVTGDNSLSITVYNHPFPRNITAQVNHSPQHTVPPPTSLYWLKNHSPQHTVMIMMSHHPPLCTGSSTPVDNVTCTYMYNITSPHLSVLAWVLQWI